MEKGNYATVPVPQRQPRSGHGWISDAVAGTGTLPRGLRRKELLSRTRAIFAWQKNTLLK